MKTLYVLEQVKYTGDKVEFGLRIRDAGQILQEERNSEISQENNPNSQTVIPWGRVKAVAAACDPF